MREEITNGRLFLRRYRKEFVPLLFASAVWSKGGEFTRWMPWCHEAYSLKESEEFVDRSLRGWENGTEYNFAIFEKDEGELVGGTGLNQFNKEHNFANLGYWVRVGNQNRGLASAATRLLAEVAFEDLPISRIEILAAVENEASQRAAAKAGAKFEGNLRQRLLIGARMHDAVLFSFVRSDFE